MGTCNITCKGCKAFSVSKYTLPIKLILGWILANRIRSILVLSCATLYIICTKKGHTIVDGHEVVSIWMNNQSIIICTL